MIVETEILAAMENIDFHFAKPSDPISKCHQIAAGRGLDRFEFEVENTGGEFPKWYYQQTLQPLLKMNRMSTFPIGMLINKAVQGVKSGGCYLNVGIWHGYTLFAGSLGNKDKLCVGVDNFGTFNGEEAKTECLRFFHSIHKDHNLSIFTMDYEDFFEKIYTPDRAHPIDVYYYDGGHSIEDHKKGLNLAEPYFRKGTVVFVDDINMEHVLNTTLDWFNSRREQWVYKCVFCEGNGHPTWWDGLLVAVKIA